MKKAYAEIILNTAKEAAVRVMVAEKKALRYQREVTDVKEDAIRMMLRFKQMMDSKVYFFFSHLCFKSLCFEVVFGLLFHGSFCLMYRGYELVILMLVKNWNFIAVRIELSFQDHSFFPC